MATDMDSGERYVDLRRILKKALRREPYLGRTARRTLKALERNEWVVAREYAGRLVVDAEIEPSAYALGPRAKALLRGRRIVEGDLKAAGGAYDVAQVLLLLGISSRNLAALVKRGGLLMVPGPDGESRFPAVQFSGSGVIEGLKEVQQSLPTRDPWAILNFLVQPDDKLDGRKPVEVLRAGEVALAASAARSMGLQGG